MMRGIRFFLSVLSVCAILGSVAPHFAKAAATDESGARVVLILNASKSMEQRFGSTTKFQAAQAALGTLLDEWETGDELAIEVVGHRFDDDCTDVDRFAPLAPPDAGRVRRSLLGLKPVGKSPIDVALKRAVADLDAERRGGAVIVLSDGTDSCSRDLCKTVAEIAAKAPNLKVHVIGMSMDVKALQGLQCLAESTGGRSFAVKDAVALQQALRETMQTIHKDVTPGISFSAVFTEAGKAVEDSIRWNVYEEKPDGSRGRSVRYGNGASARYVLPPGKYQVTASLGGASASKSIEVQAGQGARHLLNFNAGYLKLRAASQEGAAPFSDSAAWTVQENKQGKKVRVTSSYGELLDVMLPAGKYFATVELGAVKREVEVEIKAGELTEQAVVLQAGTVQLRAVLKAGGTPFDANIAWDVKEVGKADAPRLIYGSGARASFVLPEGKYRILGTYSAASSSLEVEVKAGTTQSATLDFNAGQVEIVALKQFGEPLTESVRWEIVRAGTAASNAAQSVASLSGPRIHVLLPTGKYVIKAAWKDLSGEREIEVLPEGREAVRVRLRPPED